ncbi:MAG: protein kinase [Symploca sp. SIO2D2]|nr:protein kinase [Symploca sp. SIO2D2]
MPSKKKEIGALIKKRYKVLFQYPEGGQSFTYLVEDKQSSPSSLYVIKQLKKERLSEDREDSESSHKAIKKAIERFDQEARVLKDFTQAQVPQIPRYKDYFDEEEEYYLVQEFIQGQTLREVLKTKKPLNKFQVIAFLQDVLRILSILHNKSIYHRDIKPENLIWQEGKGHIVLIDFGIIIDISLRKRLTEERLGLPGTKTYAPPELYQGHPIPSSDIYSLGMTAIEALTGEHPIHDSNLDESDRKRIDDELADILEKMIRSRSQERYQSTQEVLEALDRLNAVGNVLKQRYQITGVVNYLNQENFNTKTINYTYRAIDTEEFSQEVIIREFCPQSQDTQVLQEAQQLFDAECPKLKKINSLSIAIPQLLDYFYEDSKFYVVYEIIEGRDLSQDIFFNKELRQNWGEQKVIQFLENLLQTLHLLHTNHCLHLDIKPSKIVATDKDTFYLTGAVRIEEIANLSSTLHRSIGRTKPLGTPDYMPPEQHRGRYSPKNDLYSLGITAIQLVTGKDPQTIKTDKARKNLWPQDIKVQTELKNILEKMIDEEPIQRRRYQSAKEVIDELKKSPKSGGLFPIFKRIKNPSVTWTIIIFTFLIATLSFRYFLFVPGQVRHQYEQVSKLLDEAILEESKSKIIARDKFQLVLDGLDDILKKTHDFYPALASKSYVMDKLGYNQDDIADVCRKVLDYESKFAGAYNCLGLFYYESGKSKMTSNSEEAINTFEMALEQYRKAINYDDQNKYPFNDGLTKDEAWKNKGDVYIELKKLETKPEQKLEFCKAALRSFEEALEANPNYQEAKDKLEKIGDCSQQ